MSVLSETWFLHKGSSTHLHRPQHEELLGLTCSLLNAMKVTTQQRVDNEFLTVPIVPVHFSSSGHYYLTLLSRFLDLYRRFVNLPWGKNGRAASAAGSEHSSSPRP